MLRTACRIMTKQKGLLTQQVAPTHLKKWKVIGRMMSIQNVLPRLPVPPLEQTLQKYLKSLEPLLTPEEYENTKRICQEFGKAGGLGEDLQAILYDRAHLRTNWLSEWWQQKAYLEVRDPVVIHCSPGIVMPVQEFIGQDDQVKFAAKLITAVLDYKNMVDEQTLPVDTLGNKPLCMDQYFKIFSACRIPGIKHDSFVCYPPDEQNPPRHIVVIHKGHFFSMHVYGRNGKLLNEAQIRDQLDTIMDQSRHPVTSRLGLMTSENRNTWGQVYKKLSKDKVNRLSLERIARSIFVVCLDEPSGPSVDPEERLTRDAHQMLHGGGSKANSGNRWFDKTLQFIVGSDGSVGLSYEHASAEGPPIAAILDHIHSYVRSSKTYLPAPEPSAPERLKFNIAAEIHGAIGEAGSRLDVLISDLDLTAMHFKEFGKKFIKSQKLSPDAFFQMAIQLAYFRTHNEPCATYESGSLRRFQLGRTDTIRSCSLDSLNFTLAMQESATSAQEKASLLRKAIDSHRKYTGEVVSGHGIDRHLLGLKLAAIESGRNVPDLFMDPAYALNFHFKLSTSQVPAKTEAILCFGPVVPNGYGVCYNPQQDQILYCVSAFNSSPETKSAEFVETLKQSLIDMRTVLEQSPQAKL